jgi:ATP-dependent DNA helicase RecG
MLSLDTSVESITRVGAATAKRLRTLGIEKAEDLLFYFPFRYDDFTKTTPIDKLLPGTSANVIGTIELIQNRRSFRRRMYVTEALISDGKESLKVVWFNQPFIGKSLKIGDRVSLAGKIEDDDGSLHMSAPAYEKIQSADRDGSGADIYGRAVHTQGLVPNYHLTQGITQKQLRFIIKQAIGLAASVKDWLPDDIRQKYRLIDLSKAILNIHFPKNAKNFDEARRRLSFNELFLLQLQAQLIRREIAATCAEKIDFKKEETKKFVDNLPFKLTDSQRRSAWEIIKDLERGQPMSRLLEGDVGSGKTVVAALAILNVALAGRQSVLLAPTEILAQQHFTTLSKLFAGTQVKIGLVTASDKRMNNESGIMNQEENIKSGKLNSPFIIRNSEIIVGTHALIQEKVKFRNLALAVIDEQHRFGVDQRAKLATQTNADFTQTDTDNERANTDEAQTKTDGTKKKELLYEDVTYKVRGAIFNVKKQLGLGHKEKIYQNALEEEFKKIELKFSKEKRIDIKYDDKKIGVYQPDFIIEDRIILEIKALPFTGKAEKQQLWHYLKGSNYKLAMLVNFGRNDIEIGRIIYNSQHKSASSPRGSAYSPHLLSMTATPIPRSLALALYGDLDISIIREMPAGRKKIITKIVPEDKRQAAYKFIRSQIESGRQVFMICPLIDMSDRSGAKSVKEEFKKLDKQIFPDLPIGMLHGRLKAAEKEKVMRNFLERKIKMLVSTSVVEVGVDVPNASIMMIEGADRFGLAQLHQFRGRVGRSEHQSYCFLFSEIETEKSLKRLQALADNNDGLSLAKLDLKARGAGEVCGTAQSGFPELKIASLFDYALMKEAREAALEITALDPSLVEHPALLEKTASLEAKVHLD